MRFLRSTLCMAGTLFCTSEFPHPFPVPLLFSDRMQSFGAQGGGLLNEKAASTARSLTSTMSGLVTEVRRRAKVPLKSSWRLVFHPLPGDSWSCAYFRLLLIGLLVYKALSHALLHLIFTITAGQLLFSSFYR